MIRISMDDDDLYLPGHLEQISSLADVFLTESPTSPSAAGMYQCFVAHVGDVGVPDAAGQFSRVIPGNKFFVVPSNRFSILADAALGQYLNILMMRLQRRSKAEAFGLLLLGITSQRLST